MEEKEKSVFNTLSEINVNEYVEKKDGKSYLPWAIAWSEVKSRYPEAYYEVHETQFDEVTGFMCHTSVTINEDKLSMWLPVMDGANKSMKKVPYEYTTRYGKKSVAAATSFDINKTIMRCLVKNLAMHGLGIYIYAKEDSPTTEEDVQEKKQEVKPKIKLVEGSENWTRVIGYVSKNKKVGASKILVSLEEKYNISKALKDKIIAVVNKK